jgi:hypothetical protein
MKILAILSGLRNSNTPEVSLLRSPLRVSVGNNRLKENGAPLTSAKRHFFDLSVLTLKHALDFGFSSL